MARASGLTHSVPMAIVTVVRCSAVRMGFAAGASAAAWLSDGTSGLVQSARAVCVRTCLDNQGQPTGWLSLNGGAFEDPVNWTLGVPGPRNVARFGALASPAPFDVTLGASTVVGALIVSNQSPRFVAGGAAGSSDGQPGGRPTIMIAQTGSILGSGAVTPVARCEGVDLVCTDTMRIGGLGLGGGLVLRDASLVDGGLDIAVEGGTGSLTVDSGGAVVRRIDSGPIRVGSGTFTGIPATGSLTVNRGGLLDLVGGELLVGLNGGGTGSFALEAGAILDLNGGELVIGATTPSGLAGSSATGTLSGLVHGPGLMRVGRKSTGAVTVSAGAVFTGDIDIRVGEAAGDGALTIGSSVGLDTLTIADGGFGTVAIEGASTNVLVETLSLGSAQSQHLTIGDGASLVAGATTAAAAGVVSVLGPTASAHFQTDAWTISAASNPEAKLSAVGPFATIDLPAIALSEKQRMRLTAQEGGRVSVVSASITGSASATGGIVCEALGGGRIEVGGPLDLRAGKQSRLTVGAGSTDATPSAIHASHVLMGPESLTNFVVPNGQDPGSHDGNAGNAAIWADELLIEGKLAVTAASGWSPDGPVDIRLAASPNTTITGALVESASFFGFPSLVKADADGIVLKVIDGIEGFAMPERVTLAVGEVVNIPTIVLVDGEPYVVNSLAQWSFSDQTPIEQLGPSTFLGLGVGLTTATVTFGLAQTTVAIDVLPDPGAAFTLVSGLGLNFGNKGSGWQGPGLGVPPYGFGPRSVNAAGDRVAFASLASNLVSGDTADTDDCFTRDVGAELLFRQSGPADGSAGSWLGSNRTMQAAPTLSRDGRYLAGIMSGIIDGDIDRRIFFVDTLTGEREIIAGLGGNSSGWNSLISRVCVSDDGRFVAFTSRDASLVEGDTNGVADVFVRDRQLGTTVRVSLTPAGGQTIGANGLTDMTPDGRFVTFLRSIGLFRLAYRYDRLTGEVVTVTPGLVDEMPSIVVLDAQMSSDGAEVLFVAQGSEPIVPIPPSGTPAIGNQLYRWSELAPIGDHPVTALTRTMDGVWANAPIEGFATSGDRRSIAVATKASNLAPPGPGIGDGRTRLFRLDRTVAHSSARWEHLSRVLDEPFNDDIVPCLALSDDGTRVGLVTRASNIRPFDTGGFSDVFLLHAPLPPLGDLDGDGVVGSGDLALLLGLWGMGDPTLTGGDLDGDGSVGVTDLAILLGAWSE